MPKGGGSSLVPVWAGIKEDLNHLLKCFLDRQIVLFSDFRKLFINEGMIAMFNGRSYESEIIEFNERILCICAEYLEPFASPGVGRVLEERLFGLYAMYLFYYLQPANCVVQIRIDPDGVHNFETLLRLELIPKRHVDAYVCALKLIRDGAFRIAAFTNTHDISCYKQYDILNEEDPSLRLTNMNSPLSVIQNIIQSNEAQLLFAGHNVYENAKVTRVWQTDCSVPLPNPHYHLTDILGKAKQCCDYMSKNLPLLKHKADVARTVTPEVRTKIIVEPVEDEVPSLISILSTPLTNIFEETGDHRSSLKDKAYSSSMIYVAIIYSEISANTADLMGDIGSQLKQEEEVTIKIEEDLEPDAVVKEAVVKEEVDIEVEEQKPPEIKTQRRRLKSTTKASKKNASVESEPGNVVYEPDEDEKPEGSRSSKRMHPGENPATPVNYDDKIKSEKRPRRKTKGSATPKVNDDGKKQSITRKSSRLRSFESPPTVTCVDSSDVKPEPEEAADHEMLTAKEEEMTDKDSEYSDEDQDKLQIAA